MASSSSTTPQPCPSPHHPDHSPGAQGKRGMDAKTCGVCGDKALGYNFNAITCESCKAFFRRNALKKKEFRCPFQDSCKVDQITRRFCQKCRLRRCFEIGMKKEWIMTDEEKKRKKQKIEENRARKYVDDEPQSLLSPSSHTAAEPMTPPSLDDDESAQAMQFSPVGQFCPLQGTAKPQAVVVGVIRSDDEVAKVARLDGQSDVGQARRSFQATPSPPSRSQSTPEEKGHLLLIGEERGGGPPSPPPGLVGGEGGSVGLVQGPHTRTTTPILGLDIKEEVEFVEDIPSSPHQVAAQSWQETSHRLEVSQSLAEVSSWGPETSSPSLETSRSAGSAPQQTRFPPEMSQSLDEFRRQLETPEDTAEERRKPPEVPGDHLHIPRRQQHPPEALQSLETTQAHREAHRKYLEISSNHTETSKDRAETPSGHAETSSGHTETSSGQGETFTGHPEESGERREDSTSGFSVREALRVLQPGCEDDLSSLSISAIMDTAITAEYSSFTLLAGAEPGALNEAERVKLAELSEANKGLMAPLSEDYNFKDLNNPSLINIINLTEIAIRRLIKMAKRITAFKGLCQEDQIALLKGGCTEMMILRSLCAYDPDKDSWKIQEDHESFKSIQLKVLKSASGNVYEEHKRFIDSFRPEWRRDHNIIFLLSAITLFSPQRPNIVHPPAILHEQCSYLYLLKRYLEGWYGCCEGRSVYHSLLQRLTHLHLLSENHIRVFLEVNPCQVEPLLIEIFDLKTR